MLAGLNLERPMSAATRHVLLTGQSTFVDSDGQEYRCRQTSDDGPTHTMRLAVDPVESFGAEKCKLS